MDSSCSVVETKRDAFPIVDRFLPRLIASSVFPVALDLARIALSFRHARRGTTSEIEQRSAASRLSDPFVWIHLYLSIQAVPPLINARVSPSTARLWQLRLALSPVGLPSHPRASHQASMNRSIFGYGVAASLIEGVGIRIESTGG